MKRAVSISLVLIMILCLFTSCQTKKPSEEKELEKSTFVRSDSNDNFIFDVYKDYSVITEYIGEDFRVTIPNRLGGKPVKGIGKEAFGKSMLAIEIVDIPKNVTFIDPSAFSGNGSLTAFTVANGNPVYKSDKGIIFSKDGKSLLHYPVGKADKSYKIGSDIEKIGAYAFAGSDIIESISIPESVSEIGEYAFSKCEKLYKVNIPEKVTEISEGCFYECRALPSVEFPKNLVKIAKSAFYYNISLAEVVLPESVAEVADEAFYRCETLRKAVLSASLQKYGYKVFSGCRLLEEIDIAPQNRNFKSTEGILYSYDGKTLVECPYGKYITKLEIMNGVKNLRAYCFYRDYQGGEQDEFDDIKSINLNKVEKIGAYAFANRDAITEVNLPSTLKEIASTAFNKCQKIKKYTIKDCADYITSDGVLFTKDKKTLVAYPTDRNNKAYTIPEGTENLGDYSFSYCYSLFDLKIPESIVTVGDYCFYMSATISGKIAFGKNLKSIGKYCFSNCAGISEITFTDNTITEIPDGAFQILDGAFEFIIPEGVTKIGVDAFREIGYIRYIEIPSTVKEICTHAFYDMDDLHDLTIPASVEKFGEEIVDIMDESDPDNVTLRVTEGSPAEQYAIDNNIPYKLV